MESNPTLAIVAYLLDRYRSGNQTSVTWLNHYSAQVMNRTDTVDCVAQADLVGIDGIFLGRIVGCGARTSADTVIPALLPYTRNARVCLIGTTSSSLEKAGRSIAAMLAPDSRIVGMRNGFHRSLESREVVDWVDSIAADIVIVGAGPGKQDEVCHKIRTASKSKLVLTCGGFLDQVHQESYYPSWAYPLRLNWAVRIFREPSRLWRRYTVDAVSALASSKSLRAQIRDFDGFSSYERVLTDGWTVGE